MINLAQLQGYNEETPAQTKYDTYFLASSALLMTGHRRMAYSMGISFWNIVRLFVVIINTNAKLESPFLVCTPRPWLYDTNAHVYGDILTSYHTETYLVKRWPIAWTGDDKITTDFNLLFCTGMLVHSRAWHSLSDWARMKASGGTGLSVSLLLASLWSSQLGFTFAIPQLLLF